MRRRRPAAARGARARCGRLTAVLLAVLAGVVAACGTGAAPGPSAASAAHRTASHAGGGGAPVPPDARTGSATTHSATRAAPPASGAASGSRSHPPRAGLSTGSVTVLGHGFGQPDDLIATPDGTVYFSDFSGGRIGSLKPGGAAPRVVTAGLSAPEGLAVLPGGSLAVAEQGTNRLVRVDPATGAVSLIARLANGTRLEGVDGLFLDGGAGQLVVPDSPNGRLLLVDPATGRPRVAIAGGLGRPTGAWALHGGGRYLIADETGGRVLRAVVGGGGQAVLTVVARLNLPDDVVVARSGNAFVNSLAGTVWEVSPRVRPVLRGLRDPQGLALGPDGTLIVAETGRNRILRLTPPAPGAPPLTAPP